MIRGVWNHDLAGSDCVFQPGQLRLGNVGIDHENDVFFVNCVSCQGSIDIISARRNVWSRFVPAGMGAFSTAAETGAPACLIQ